MLGAAIPETLCVMGRAYRGHYDGGARKKYSTQQSKSSQNQLSLSADKSEKSAYILMIGMTE